MGSLVVRVSWSQKTEIVKKINRDPSLSNEEKQKKMEQIGQRFGKCALYSLSVNMPYNSYNSLKRLLNFICHEFWLYLFDNSTSDITSPNPQSISFKDNNFILLKRLDASRKQQDKKNEYIELLKTFVAGIIKGVLVHFDNDAEIKLIFQNDSLFVNINCYD